MFGRLPSSRESAVLSLRRDISAGKVHFEDIQHNIQKMTLSVQSRISGEDVVVPELYRQFQQDR